MDEIGTGKSTYKALSAILITTGVLLALINACARESVTPNSTNVEVSTMRSPPDEHPQYGFDDPQWWEHAVFYEIFVRSFYDSNGDGVGDFNGIIEKLDYLNDGDPLTTQDLGINAIWLMPIFPSPSYHGYDVTDYFSINPEYGTMEDFKQLLDETHKRGIHVIIDFVLNHTSSQHPWFIAAQNPEDEFHNWFIWSNTNPGYFGPWNESVWHKSDNGLYYYGVFWEGMPDLNFETSELATKMEEAAKFWLVEVGVDGFRVDGAKHLIEEGEIQENTKSTIAWFQSFKCLFKMWNPSAMTVGEIWDSSYITTSYIKSNSFDMVFNFDLANAIITTVAMGDAQALNDSIASEVELYNYRGMGTFLTNHDMNRVMSQLGNDLNLMKHAATVLLTIPGTPFLYYGEEIGMVGMKPDEQIRTPMQWSPDNNGGFTTGNPWEVLNFSFKEVNVLSQVGEETSLLSLYRTLINLRLNHVALLDGEYEKVDTSNPALYAGIRAMDDDVFLTLVNLKNTTIENPVLKFKGDLPLGKYHVKILMGNEEIDSLVEIVRNGEYLEFSFLKPIASHQNFVLQLIFDK